MSSVQQTFIAKPLLTSGTNINQTHHRRQSVKTKLKHVTREIATIPLSKLPIPKASLLDPLLGRMTVSTLRGIFENEISHCLKAMEAYSKLDQSDASCNARRRLILDQFQKCWDQYGPHLPKDVLNTRLVEVGEALLHIQGFHDVADTLCFTKYIKEVSLSYEEDRVNIAMKTNETLDGISILMHKNCPDAAHETSTSKRSLTDKESELIRRCQYGLCLAEFLGLFMIDISLQAEHVRKRVITVLSRISSIAGECCTSKDQEWLALEGAKHILMIIDALWLTDFEWNDALVYLSESLTYIQNCKSILTIKNSTWLSEIFSCTFQKKINGWNVLKAKSVFQQYSEIVDTIFPVGHGCQLTIEEEELKQSAYKALNDMSFLIIIAEMADGHFKTTLNSLDSNETGVKAEFRQVWYKDECTQYQQVSKLRKSIKFDLEGGRNSEIGEFARPSLAIPAKRTSITMTTQLKADIEAKVVKSMAPFKSSDAASMIKKLSITSRNSMPVKFKMQHPESSSVFHSIIKVDNATEPEVELESIAEFSPVPIPASLADSSTKPKKHNIPMPKLPKKVKGIAVVQESDEHKAKRLILTELIEILRCFEGDKEKLRLVTAALELLSKRKESSASENNVNMTSLIFHMLLDLGFELLTMPNDTMVKKGGFLSMLIGEEHQAPSMNFMMYAIGRLPSLREISCLIEDLAFKRFNYVDLMKLSRQIFQNHQWERFVVIGQVLEHHLSELISIGDKTINTKEAASEITLRAAVISFHNIWHSERKVLFQDDGDLTATAQDLRWKKFRVPETLHNASVALLHSISECLEFNSLVQEFPYLFLDCVKLLWSFVEPFVQEFMSVDNDRLAAEIESDDTVLRILKAAHLIISEFPSREIEFGATISLKLAHLLEKINNLTDACLILEQTSSRLTEARRELGDGPGAIEMIANHAGIYVEDGNLNDYKIGELERVKLNIPYLEIEVYQSLFRCDMKKLYEDDVQLQQKQKNEYERLTKKTMKSKCVKSMPVDSYVHFMCGENLVLKSIMLTVYAAYGYNLSILEKHKMLVEAVGCLKLHAKQEKILLNSLNESVRDTRVSSVVSMCCPTPTIIRRTPTSITIRPNHMMSDTGHILIPASYQGFCKEYGAGRVALNDADYPGSGETVKAAPTSDITISGLKPNKKYMFAVAAFDESGQIMGRGIGETSKGVTTLFTLPLIHCWSTISIVSHHLGCDDVADMSFEQIWQHFVKFTCHDDQLNTLAQPNNTGVVHQKVFTFHQHNMNMASSDLKRRFINCIHAKIDRDIAQVHPAIHTDKSGMRNVLKPQITRLLTTRALLIALEVSKDIDDYNLLLQTAVKIVYCLFPFFKHGIASPFAVHSLIMAHESILACESAKYSLESDVVVDVFGPLILLLVNRLVQHQEFISASKIAEDCIKYINVRSGNFDSTVIANSSAIEAQWTGVVPRTKRYTTNQRKNLILNIQSDNNHHITAALSGNYKVGYNQEPRKLEALREQLELYILHCACFIKPPQSFEKRFLESPTTLKDVYHMFVTCGADNLSVELLKFKKNPRYLELVAKFMQWNTSKGNIESTIRIITEVLEWINLRNQFLSHASEILEGSLDSISKETLLHRQKRSIFVEKKVQAPDSKKDERKSRAKHRHHKINSLVDGGVTRKQHIDDIEIVSPIPRSREGTLSRPTSKERQNSKSRSPSVERSSNDVNELTANARGIGRKRKKLTQRNMFLSALSQVEKDRIEKSVKCLDSQFGKLWKRKRFLKRLRLIIKFESRWKSDIHMIMGLQTFRKLESEFSGIDFLILTQKHFQRIDFDGLNSNSSHMYTNSPMSKLIYLDSGLVKNAVNYEVEQSKLLPDMLQSFVQSAVLAARVKLWKNVLNSSRVLWNVTQCMIKSERISKEFKSNYLWKPFFIVSDYLMDMLEKTKVSNELVQMEDPLSGRCMPNLSQNTISGYETRLLPFTTYDELMNNSFISSWINSYGEDEEVEVNLRWCFDFVAYAIDCMIFSGRLKRAYPIIERLNALFQGVFNQWYVNVRRRIGIPLASNFEDAAQTSNYDCLFNARSLFKSFSSHIGADQSTLKFSLDSLSKFTASFEAYETVSQEVSRQKDRAHWKRVIFNEFGDLWYTKGNFREAAYYWSKAIDEIFGMENVLNSKLLLSPLKNFDQLGGIKMAVLAATIIMKIKLCPLNDLDKSRKLNMFASNLVIFSLKQSLPHPSEPLCYVFYKPLNLAPNLSLFSDWFLLDPSVTAILMCQCVTDLLGSQKLNEALILTSFIAYIATDVLMDDQIYVHSVVLKCKILLEMGLVKQSFEILIMIFQGHFLLKNQTPQGHFNLQYNVNEPCFFQTNWAVLKTLADMEISDTLKKMYSLETIYQIELARSSILVKFLKRVSAHDPTTSNSLFVNLLSESSLQMFEHLPFSAEILSIYQLPSMDPLNLTMNIPTTLASMSMPTSVSETTRSSHSINLSSDIVSKTNNIKFVPEWALSFEIVLQKTKESLKRVLNISKTALEQSSTICGTQSRWFLAIFFEAGVIYSSCHELSLTLEKSVHWVMFTQVHALSFANKYNISLDSEQWLQSRIMTVEYLLAAGLLQQANIIAEIGIKESRDFKSKAFELKFGGLSLLSQVGVSKFDELYTALLNYQKMVAQEQRLHLDNYGLAECWDMIGDIVTLIAPDKHEVIAIAYDQAYDFILKFLEPRSGFKIPNASHSYYHARKAVIMFKRALHYKNTANTSEALKVINETAMLAHTVKFVIPITLLQRITIALAEIMYRNHQQGVILKSKAQYRSDISRAFSDALVAEVAVGGTDYAVLKTSFEGLLAIAIEEGDEFSARRLSHCLSYVAKLEMKSASKKYDDISARPLSASGTSDFIASQWVLFKKGASLTLDQFFSMEDYTDLDQPSLTHILNMRQGIIQMRNALTIYTSDSLRQTAEIRLRRFNYYLMNVATAPTFKQKLCFSNIMFPSVVVQTSIDYTMASPKLQASFNVANIKSQDMVCQACIQWLNLPVRVLDGDGEGMNDRLWNLVICFGLPPVSDNEKYGGSTNHAPSSGGSRRSNSGKLGSGRSRRDSITLKHTAGSRRASALILVSTTETKGPTLSPIYTTKVSESAVETVIKYARAAEQGLKKFDVTKDQKYLKIAERMFDNVLISVIRTISKMEIDLGTTGQKPPLTEATLNSILQMFSVTEGYTSQTPNDATLFEWIQRVVGMIH